MVASRQINATRSRASHLLANWATFEAYQMHSAISNFESVLVGWRELQPKLARVQAEQASDFNIFGILGIGHLEVSTHSPLLRTLLDRQGTHGQGSLFLARFLMRLGFDEREANDSYWRAVPWQQDNIDICIENRQLCKAVFIENKIYSNAHSGQITRYYRIWKRKWNGGIFVYLSIDGNDPGDLGFSEDTEYPKAVILSEIKRLSYTHDIHDWIEECKEKIQAQNVRAVLAQYLRLIETFKGGKMNRSEKEILDFLCQPANYAAIREIQPYIEKAKERKFIEKRDILRDVLVRAVKARTWAGYMITSKHEETRTFLNISKSYSDAAIRFFICPDAADRSCWFGIAPLNKSDELIPAAKQILQKVESTTRRYEYCGTEFDWYDDSISSESLSPLFSDWVNQALGVFAKLKSDVEAANTILLSKQ
jgi:hypothetical protein